LQGKNGEKYGLYRVYPFTTPHLNLFFNFLGEHAKRLASTSLISALFYLAIGFLSMVAIGGNAYDVYDIQAFNMHLIHFIAKCNNR